MTKIQVLDKGFVRLVAHHGDDLMVVNAARVSFAKESEWEEQEVSAVDISVDHPVVVDDSWQMLGAAERFGYTRFRRLSDKDANLIRFLARGCTTQEFDALVDSMVETGDREVIEEALWRFRDTPLHFTAFGHPQITLHFKFPIFIARQTMRSNIGICWNEVSRRYVKTPPEFYEPEVWRGTPEGSIKQGSGEPIANQAEASAIHKRLCLQSEEAYRELLALGVCPEQARGDLLTHLYTEVWGTFSLAALARFYKLRADSHAQKEIREFSAAIDVLVRPMFPVSWSALVGE
jgi:thymidylate synthase (FAD)